MFHTSTAMLVAILTTAVAQAAVTPGYNVEVPEEIMTPDTIETRIGTMEFYEGVPTEKTVNYPGSHAQRGNYLQII